MDIEKRLFWAGFVAALLIYGVLIGVNFDPAVTRAQSAVVGEGPFGVSTRTYFIALQAILFLPIFVWAPALVKLMHYARDDKADLRTVLLHTLLPVFELIGLYTKVDDTAPRDVKRARTIFVIGLVYFIGLIAFWIVISTGKGAN